MPCVDNAGSFVVDELAISPKEPHTNEEVTVSLSAHIKMPSQWPLALSDEPSTVDLSELALEGSVWACRRYDDCMPIAQDVGSVCNASDISPEQCTAVKRGHSIHTTKKYFIPLGPIRGTYMIGLDVMNTTTNEKIACYRLEEIELLASLTINKLRDARDAIFSFIVAASASHALAGLFPVFSGGLLPKISGFLCIGMLVGPFCCNLITHMHIFMMGGYINRVSLAFIGGAAGAEIFLPEFQKLLDAMFLQVICISVITVLVVTFSIMVVSQFGIISIPAIEMQPTLFAQFSVALLSGALMTARSPASAIAIIAEMGCGAHKCAKMALGITVLSDIVVLVMFSVCQQVVRIATLGTPFGMGVLVRLFASIATSIMLGAVSGQCLRLVLPLDDPDTLKTRHFTKDFEGNSSEEGETAAHTPAKEDDWKATAFRGLLLIGFLYCTFYIAEQAAEWTNDQLRLEPLLACTIASCVCGHDESRRHHLLQSLSFWTPYILLPFFTLAGASLELPSLGAVFPAALMIVCLRLVGIAAGSFTGGVAYAHFFKQTPVKAACKQADVRNTWLTLIAQAGVTLGLVLELTSQSAFKKWSRQFGTMMLGVVCINQLLGPIFCRIGLKTMIAAEEEGGAAELSELTSDSDDNSSAQQHTPRMLAEQPQLRPMDSHLSQQGGSGRKHARRESVRTNSDLSITGLVGAMHPKHGSSHHRERLHSPTTGDGSKE